MPELPLQGLLFLLGRKPGPNFQSTNLNSPFASCDNFVSALKSPPELFTAFDVTFSNYLKDSGPHTMTGNDATNWPITRASSLMVTDCFLFRSEHTDSIIFLQSSIKVTVMSSEFSQNPKFLLLLFFSRVWEPIFFMNNKPSNWKSSTVFVTFSAHCSSVSACK